MDVAIDTSTTVQSIAVGRDGVVLEQLAYARRQHSRGLADAVHQALQRHDGDWGQVRAYVVGLGPGSFTGLRVSLSLVKGLCAATTAKAIGVTSLRATPASLPTGDVCVVAWDAYKHLVYGAVYETGPNGAERLAPLVEAPEAFAERLPALGSRVLTSGNAFARYADAFEASGVQRSPAPALEPCAGGLLRHAYAAALEPVDAATLEPVYLRRSAAEEAREAKLRAESRSTPAPGP